MELRLQNVCLLTGGVVPRSFHNCGGTAFQPLPEKRSKEAEDTVVISLLEPRKMIEKESVHDSAAHSFSEESLLT